MRRSRGVVVGLVTAGIAVVAASAVAAKPAQGVYGTVTVSFPDALCPGDGDCTKPLVGAMLVFSREGRQAATVRTNAEGGYRAALAPGRYAVAVRVTRGRREIEPHDGRRAAATLTLASRTVQPRLVSVAQGRFRHVDFEVELGARSGQR